MEGYLIEWEKAFMRSIEDSQGDKYWGWRYKRSQEKVMMAEHPEQFQATEPMEIQLTLSL